MREFRDEFGRAVAYAIARAEGASYDDAVEKASDEAASSPRRVKAALRWVESKVGMPRIDLQDTVQYHLELSKRIVQDGVQALSANEIVTIGAVNATLDVFQRDFHDDARATQFMDGTLQTVLSEVTDRAFVTIRGLLLQFAEQGQFPVKTLDDLAIFARAAAEPIAAEISARLRGCSNSG
jgi:hypothetical protein